MVIFIIKIIEIILMILQLNVFGFGYKKSQNGERVEVSNKIEELFLKYDAKYIGKDEKVLYLTFDCGYENGKTKNIVDTLIEENVNATFFVTGHFMNQNKDLINYISDNELFIIGNHTNKHKDVTKISNEEIIYDLASNEEIYKNITNKEMVKFIRPPEGKFNENYLKLTYENGYKSIFWSISHVDWIVDKQKGKDKALDTLISQIHNGGIVLLHNVSEDNMLILSDFIKYCRSIGYEFKSINDLYN